MGRKNNWKKRAPAHIAPPEVNLDDLEPSVVAEVESVFKKKFAYEKTSQPAWTLPDPDTWGYGVVQPVEELLPIKTRLNEVKSSLSHIDINRWHAHTTSTNRAGDVLPTLLRMRKPELGTQAWCKFHEILGTFPLVSRHADLLSSVHLCEAPGAFITSLNHYLRGIGFRGVWEWLGNTLNPYYEGNNLGEMIGDDRLIRHTLARWCFGADDTGDIMKPENMCDIGERVAEIQPITLVTADGSIDCQNDPEHQEVLTSRLHLAEVAMALSILSPGGAFVVKMFTLFEAHSVSLMYLLNCLFSEVCVFKPATSKAGNSEVYVVCLDYQGMSQEGQARLRALAGNPEEQGCLFPLDLIPQSFRQVHMSCCQQFMTYQVQTIEENLALYHQRPSTEKLHRITQVRQACAATYISRFGVITLRGVQHVVPPNVSGSRRSQTQRSRMQHRGSYNERQEQRHLAWPERVATMPTYDLTQTDTPVMWYHNQAEVTPEEISSWPIVVGAPIGRVVCSCFCSVKVLNHYNDMVSNVQAPRACPTVVNQTQQLKEVHQYLTSYRHHHDSTNIKPSTPNCKGDTRNDNYDCDMPYSYGTEERAANLLGNFVENGDIPELLNRVTRTSEKESKYGTECHDITLSEMEESCKMNLLVAASENRNQMSSAIVQNDGLNGMANPVTDNVDVINDTSSDHSDNHKANMTLISNAGDNDSPKYVTQDLLGDTLLLGDGASAGRGCLRVLDRAWYPYSRGQEELDSRMQMCDMVCHVIQTFLPGDHVMLGLTSSLTRFTASLVFILSTLFEKVTVIPGAVGGVGQYFVGCVFRGFTSWPLPYLDLCRRVQQHKQHEAHGWEVLQFVPNEYLHEPRFYKFLHSSNDRHLKRQINYMITDEKTFLQK